ncbi:MAG TPA: hypothetical protein VHR65_01955, partial [Solirubrobacterales bacterium]|nr:hypothetical protein [Solirubrobacterales bacterium]
AEKLDPKPEPASYEGVLVATGTSGGLAHRPLTITVEAAKKDKEEAGGNVLNPKQPVDITFTSVNYLPSPLSNVTYLLLLAAVAFLLAMVLPFNRALRKRAQDLPLGLGALAVLLAIVGLFFLISRGPWTQPSFHAISSRPIGVAPEVEDGSRGSAASANGKLAQLVVSNHEMQPQNLTSATKYEGTYDLTPDVEEGGAKATIDVHDFWLYALLTICLGIYIGYRLRLWFQTQRPKAKLEVHLAEVLESYEAEKARYDKQDKGMPYCGLAIDERVGIRRGKIHELLESGDTATATTKLTALETYLDKFFALRTALESLDNAREELAAAHGLNGFGLRLDEVNSYNAALPLLSEAVDSSDPDEDAVKLGKRLTEVETQIERVRAVAGQTRSVDDELKAAEGTLPGAAGEQRTKLAAFVAACPGIGEKTLQARDLEALKPVREELDTAIRALHGSAAAPATTAAPAPAAVAAKIQWKVSAGEEPATGKVHRGDRVSFSIEVGAEQSPPPRAIEIDFGDGEKTTRVLPEKDGPVPLTIGHRYRTGDPASIVVRTAHGQAELGQATVEIDKEPRVAKLKAQLAESDRIVSWVSLLLAAGSGLVALYFVDPAWGEPGDYLAAALWGGTVSEGLKLAASIAERAWPTS